MKPRLGTFTLHSKLLWLLASFAVLAPPAGAQTIDDDFADFRIPEHRSRQGAVSFQGGFSRAATDAIGSQRRGESGFGQIQGSIRGFFDSEPSQHVWQVSTAFQGVHQWSRFVSETGGTRSEAEPNDRRTSETWLVSGAYRRYLGERPLAVGLAAVASGAYLQTWDRFAQRFSSPLVLDVAKSSRDEDLYQTYANLSVTAGAGRVRDATGIYDAVVLEERLRATGALTRPLSRAARQKLAALHYAEPEYFAGTDRPEKLFWRDVERVLREDGALRDGGLDAYDVLRVLETRYPANVNRMRGYFAGPVVVLSHDDVIVRRAIHDEVRTYTGGVLTGFSEGRLSTRDEVSDDQILPGLQAEAHRPLGLRVQLDGAARVLLPMLHVDEGLETQASGGASWFVHERWLAALSAAYARRYQSGDPGRVSFDAWTVDYGVTLVYFVQDHVSAQLQLFERQGRNVPATFARAGNIAFGLTYAFWRGFDAPGLTDPVRPLAY